MDPPKPSHAGHHATPLRTAALAFALLAFGAGCGDDDATGRGDAATEGGAGGRERDLAQSLTESVRFDSVARVTGLLPDTTDVDVTLSGFSDLSVAPGGTVLLGFFVSGDDPEDPVDTLLVRFGDADGYLEIPIADPGVRDVPLSLASDACDGRCNIWYAIELTIKPRTASGRVGAQQTRTLYLDCTGAGEARHCGADSPESMPPEPGANAPRCGDGTRDSGEECDDGAMNDDRGACTRQCRRQRCGDGLLGAAEECDSGAANGGGGLCTSSCTRNFCGDGYRFQTAPAACVGSACRVEACDDGAMNGQGEGVCLSDCSGRQRCGNGVREGSESCDDGANNNTANGACNATCTRRQVCGDGQLDGNETCDDGAANNTGEGSCVATCTARQVCGNGTTEGSEICDDGNTRNYDGCSADCLLVEPFCQDFGLAAPNACPTGATRLCKRDDWTCDTNGLDARLACEACYGAGADCSGSCTVCDGYSVIYDTNSAAAGRLYFTFGGSGFCGGPAGRIVTMADGCGGTQANGVGYWCQ